MLNIDLNEKIQKIKKTNLNIKGYLWSQQDKRENRNSWKKIIRRKFLEK